MISLSCVTAYAINKAGLPNTFKKAVAATQLPLRKENVVLV